MSDSTALIPSIISGVSALFGGALGTLLVERYRTRHQRLKEQKDHIDQATNQFVAGFTTLQDHMWHKRLNESHSQLSSIGVDFSTNLPYLPTILTSLGREAVPLFYGLLFIIATSTADPKDHEDDEVADLWQYTLKLAMMMNRSLESWRSAGDESALQEAVSGLAQARSFLGQAAEEPSKQ